MNLLSTTLTRLVDYGRTIHDVVPLVLLILPTKEALVPINKV